MRVRRDPWLWAACRVRRHLSESAAAAVAVAAAGRELSHAVDRLSACQQSLAAAGAWPKPPPGGAGIWPPRG